jgi:hypothetical protein
MVTGPEMRRRPMRTTIFATAVVAAVGVATAFATQGGVTGNPAVSSGTQYAQLHTTQTPQQQLQLAYVMPPFHASEENGQG